MTLAEHLNPFFTRRVTLETALSPTQCAERLRAAAIAAALAAAIAILVPMGASLAHRGSTAHDDDWLVAHLCELLDGSEIPRALN